MTKWPGTIPHDLRTALAEIDGFRAPVADADRWAVIKEWLEKHEVSAPAKLPTAPEITSE